MYEDTIKTLNELAAVLDKAEGLNYYETSARQSIKQAAVDLAAGEKLRYPLKEEPKTDAGLPPGQNEPTDVHIPEEMQLLQSRPKKKQK